MQDDQILDQGLLQDFGDYLEAGETIEWEGKPEPGITFALLEREVYFDAMSGVISIPGMLLVGMVVGGYYFYMRADWVGLVLTVLAGVGLFLAPDVVKYMRQQNTRYAFSQRRVFFKLWRWGKSSIWVIDLADVVKVTWQEYADKRGIVYFMMAIPRDFYTQDFQAGRRREYPTFEMVPGAVALAERLEGLRRRANASKQENAAGVSFKQEDGRRGGVCA